MNNKNERKPNQALRNSIGNDMHLFWTDGRKMTYRASQMKIGWTEEQVKQLELALEKHTCQATG